MRWLAATALVLLAILAGMIWSAAWSDFRFRGCRDIPRQEWEATVNCQDGWFAMIVFGGLSALCAGGAIWSIGGRWRA